MAKNIRGFLENLFEYYFLNIIVNVNFFSDLKFEYYYECYVSDTLKYCYKKALNKKLKLMGGDIKFFPKKLLGHEIFSSMIYWATKFFLKN